MKRGIVKHCFSKLFLVKKHYLSSKIYYISIKYINQLRFKQNQIESSNLDSVNFCSMVFSTPKIDTFDNIALYNYLK